MVIYNDKDLKAIDKDLQCLVIVDKYIAVYRIVDGKTDYIAWKIANFKPQATKSKYKKKSEVLTWLSNLGHKKS